MKKILILTLLAVLMGTGKMMAQNSRLAELRHNGDITYFYGSNALINAHGAAQNGDTITLSPGTFSAVDITKAILLRGAYIWETLIVGDLSINISDGEGSLFQMEDLRLNQSNLTITKVPPMSLIQRCRLEGYVTVNDEITFSMCVINGWNQTIIGDGMKKLYNCSFLMARYSGIVPSKKNWMVVNCCIYCRQCSGYGGVFRGMEDAVFYNCIFHEDAIFKDHDNYPESTSGAEFYNCIATGTGNFFGNLGNKHGSQNVSADVITGDIWYERLTEEADSIYLGFDGKPVGMYGGSDPFDPTPAYPRITKFEVAPKAINGTLRVDVEVNGEE